MKGNEKTETPSFGLGLYAISPCGSRRRPVQHGGDVSPVSVDFNRISEDLMSSNA
jgi:hypothetical protein